MSRWIFDLIWMAAAVIGIVLAVMYFRAAQKLYARDKEHPAFHRAARGDGRPGVESARLQDDAAGESNQPQLS